MGTIKELRFWTYKILPLVYDDSLSYLEVLSKVKYKLNEVIKTTNELPDAISAEIEKQLQGNGDVYKNLFSGILNAIATDEGDGTYTPNVKHGGEVIWLNGTLYEVVQPMAVGVNYVIGTNIVPVAIDEMFNNVINTISAHNEYWHGRATSKHDTATYMWWKGKLYRVDADIDVNDIISERVTTDGTTTGQLTNVNIMDEVTAHYLEMHEADNNLQTQIDGNDGDIEDIRKSLATYTANNANPKLVISTSDMTNHNQVYVLNTNGHIYYWNGNEFIDSGLVYTNYASNLNNLGYLITANNYGASLADFDSVTGNTCYQLLFSNGATEIPAHSPFGNSWKSKNVCVLFNFENSNSTGKHTQIFFADNKVYMRNSALIGEWYDWTENDTHEFITKTDNLIGSSNYTESLPDLNTVTGNKVYALNFSVGATAIPAHTPYKNVWGGASEAILINLENEETTGKYTQLFFTDGRVWTRNSTLTNTWTNWTCAIDNCLYKNYAYIGGNNYTTVLPDCNNATGNKVYTLLFARGATNIPANTPYGSSWGSTNIATLFCLENEANTGKYNQIFIGDGQVWVRNSTTIGSWSDWKTKTYPTFVEKIDHLIGGSNYTELLPDLNDVTGNKIYTMIFANGATAYPAHTPYVDKWVGTQTATLIVTQNQESTGRFTQIFIHDGHTWTRNSLALGDWSNWETEGFTFYVGEGKQFTSFSRGLAEAIKYPNSKLIVGAGTYDIESEFKELYGDTFFDNYDSSSSYGPLARNGVHIIASPQSKLVFNYTGDNSIVHTNFSPINIKGNGCILEGVNIEASNCRYAVHEELGGSNTFYTTLYKDCNMKIDNSKNPNFKYDRCIGGGLGPNGLIRVINCYFEGVGLENMRSLSLISWHNSSTENAQSKIVVKGCYFAGKGTVRLGYFGTTTKITQAFVSDNSLGSALIKEPEISTLGPADVDNFEYIAFNNVIRES